MNFIYDKNRQDTLNDKIDREIRMIKRFEYSPWYSVLIVYGKSDSGKSTFLKELSKELKITITDSCAKENEIGKIVKEKGVVAIDEAENYISRLTKNDIESGLYILALQERSKLDYCYLIEEMSEIFGRGKVKVVQL